MTKALLLKGYRAELINVENTLRGLQRAVDGPIETIGLRDGGVMIADRDSVLKDCEYNALASLLAGTAVYGAALIVGADGDEFDDVPAHYVADILPLSEEILDMKGSPDENTCKEKDRAAQG